MTNEELMSLYQSGDDTALEKLYRNNIGFIRSIARTVAERFERDDFDTIDELAGQGAFAFTVLLKKKAYDPTFGKLTTYLYPHLHGSMTRHLRKLLDYERRILSADALAGIDDESYVFNEKSICINYYETIALQDILPIEHLVFLELTADLLRDIFDTLNRKERSIIGKYYGVFGYRVTSLDAIAMTEMMTIDGVMKFVARTVEKMYERSDDLATFRHRWWQARRMIELAWADKDDWDEDCEE